MLRISSYHVNEVGRFLIKYVAVVVVWGDKLCYD